MSSFGQKIGGGGGSALLTLSILPVSVFSIEWNLYRIIFVFPIPIQWGYVGGLVKGLESCLLVGGEIFWRDFEIQVVIYNIWFLWNPTKLMLTPLKISAVSLVKHILNQNRRRQWEKIKWKFQYPELETEENSENKIKFLKIPREASWTFPYRERRAR